MSIKRYLFLLVGGIVVTIALIELLLLAYFKQQFNQEIVEKSQKLSAQIIDFAIENIDFDETSQPDTAEKTTTQKTKAAFTVDKAGCQVTHTSSFDGPSKAEAPTALSTIKIECPDGVHRAEDDLVHYNTTTIAPLPQETLADNKLEKVKVQWKKQLHELISDKHQSQATTHEYSFVVKNGNGPIEREFVTNNDTKSSSIDSFIDNMFYLILAASAIALLLAFWLSIHFTRPLQRLSKGFHALEQGEFGIQVETTGINEYRKTLSSFNHMSKQLAILAASEKQLQQRSHLAELGEISRGLAHTLRNPMHTIGLSVEQLRDPYLPELARQKLQDKIQHKIEHIDKTIKALLTLTSAEIRREETVPIHSVIQDVILEMRANEPGVKITCLQLPKTLTVKGAESEVRAIIHTLIVNAVEASEKGGEVTVSLKEDCSFVVVEVNDDGQGLSPDVVDKLFQPHVSTKPEGAGMGLYISRRLATLYYGGDIFLENRSSGGCCAKARLRKENT